MTRDEDMSRLTIAQSQKFYRDHGDELLKDYQSLVNLIRSHRIDSAVGNSNYLHALLLTRIMLDETSQQFRMLTGGVLDGFFSTLSDQWRAMLVRIRNRRKVDGDIAFARILVVNGGEPCGALKSLEDEFSDVLQVIGAKYRDNSLTHFIVGDHDMVRDEKEHGPLDPESDANTVLADVSFYSPAKAHMFSTRFDTFWKAVSAAPQVAC